MFRYVSLIVLPAVLFLMAPTPAKAQGGDILPGTYVNTSKNQNCYVYRSGAGYIFVNENGSRARFASIGPGQLGIVSGQWDPNVVATVSQDRFGRTVIQFDAPNTRTGFWVSAN